MNKTAKIILIIAIVLGVLDLGLFCWTEGPDLIEKSKNRVGNMETGPASYSKETQEVFELTQTGADKWAQIYTIKPASDKIKSIRFAAEIFENGKWHARSESEFNIEGMEKGGKLYISFTPERGGVVNFSGASAALKSCGREIKGLDMSGSITLTEKEKIVPDTRIVYGIFFYGGSDDENVDLAAAPTSAYNNKEMLEKYDKVIAVTCECSTKELH